MVIAICVTCVRHKSVCTFGVFFALSNTASHIHACAVLNGEYIYEVHTSKNNLRSCNFLLQP